ncbi:MAG: carbamoyltransferase HypF [Firmicutes bacterium]|nr:carbamoyltransferase HypF [Bacillota bacterium]
MNLKRAVITLNGVVQGVGFRPFIYRLAHHHNLPGVVFNSTEGVVVEVEGLEQQLQAFYRAILAQRPPLSRIIDARLVFTEPAGYRDFQIRPSVVDQPPTVLVTPDIGICDDCAREMFDPADRRHGYPFINCTNCGPRFTIMRGLPYDRRRTTMDVFEMCPACQAEYEDPGYRRFHAQPNACPDCGPRAWLASARSPRFFPPDSESAGRAGVFEEAREWLKAGKILAVRGLGGFHLLCDAHHQDAVRALRARKHREAKPLAIMCRNMDAVRGYCQVSSEEQALLESWRRPIVLLEKVWGGRRLAPEIAPSLSTLGVMLPDSPLHMLLFDDDLDCLVATSGNISDAPLVTDNREAFARLGQIADGFLLHNREIINRCDDSVAAVVAGEPVVYRRSRGYAPQPLEYGKQLRSVLALGGDQKNTFCLAKGSRLFLSQHIGEISGIASLEFLTTAVERFMDYFEIAPTTVAHDLHPEYRTTRLARELFSHGRPLVAVQHHEAHLASCMAENHLDEPVLGVVLDGTGYGRDGRLWGFEFFHGSLTGFERFAHLEYTPLPGGEAAIRRPGRMLFSHLLAHLGESGVERAHRLDPGWYEPGFDALRRQIETRLNAPLTSGAGRFFDAVSALLGICRLARYDGQPAIELEAAISHGGAPVAISERYGFDMDTGGEPWRVLVAPVWSGILEDMERGAGVPVVSARFHNTVIAMVLEVLAKKRQITGINKVALSGGVFQNRYLLENLIQLLKLDGFEVHFQKRVSTNDGGISLGQAVIADAMLKEGE